MTAKALAAELIGTFALVAVLCGVGLLGGPAGGGPLSVALAAGLALAALGYGLGHLSGGHFNPAVTLGLVAGGRFDTGHAIAYVVAQVAGAFAAAYLMSAVVAGALSAGPGVGLRWGSYSALAGTYGGTNGFSLIAVAVAAALAAAVLVLVLMGAASKAASGGFAPLAYGAVYLVLQLALQPVLATALNPAHASAVAVLAGGQPQAQLWLFWAAPVAGAILGGAIGRWLLEE